MTWQNIFTGETIYVAENKKHLLLSEVFITFPVTILTGGKLVLDCNARTNLLFYYFPELVLEIFSLTSLIISCHNKRRTI